MEMDDVEMPINKLNQLRSLIAPKNTQPDILSYNIR